jgi:hypothetical protein
MAMRNWLFWGAPFVALLSITCAGPTIQERLVRAPLQERCDLARQVAFFAVSGDPRVQPEAMVESDCVKELASDGGMPLVRAILEKEQPKNHWTRSSLFTAEESCRWSDIRLVSDDFGRVDKKIESVVSVALHEPDGTGIPFWVGVESRESDAAADDVHYTSPCGAITGHIVWRGGRWEIRP